MNEIFVAFIVGAAFAFGYALGRTSGFPTRRKRSIGETHSTATTLSPAIHGTAFASWLLANSD